MGTDPAHGVLLASLTTDDVVRALDACSLTSAVSSGCVTATEAAPASHPAARSTANARVIKDEYIKDEDEDEDEAEDEDEEEGEPSSDAEEDMTRTSK